MKKFTFIIITSLSWQFISGQNIVSNGSFDTYTTPPNNIAQICRASDWSNPNGLCQSGSGGTSDFFHADGSGLVQPPNIAWATLSPHTGGGMAGFSTWYTIPANFREYIRCQLTTPLVVGTEYQVSFWLSNGENSIITYGTNNIGIVFSSSPLTQSGTSVINAVPQCEITSVVYSASWQQFTFTYTATAAFEYICIGNFRNDASTTAVLQGGNSNSGAYYYIDDIVIEPVSVLPIQLTSFKASADANNMVDLSWSTASEINNEFFYVERSRDGNEFDSIGAVHGSGNAVSSNRYYFPDQNPLKGWNYYRLRQVDYDGNFRYSIVVATQVDDGEMLWIYPNPVHSLMNIHIRSSPNDAGAAEFAIYDLFGQMVLKQEMFLKEGDNMIQFPADQFADGTYFLKVLTLSGVSFEQKFIVE